MSPDPHIAILAKAARERLDLLEDGETSLSYYGEADEIRAALAWADGYLQPKGTPGVDVYAGLDFSSRVVR